MGKLLLQGVDTFHVEADYLAVPAELLHVGFHAHLPCQFLQGRIVRDDECRYELALVRYDDYLVDVAVHHEFGLYHLGRYVLAVAGLEEVLDAVGEEEFPVLDVTCIARVEPPLAVDGLFRDLLLMVVAARHGVSLEEYLVVLPEPDFQSPNDTSHGTYRVGLAVPGTAHRGCRLSESVACHHVDAGSMDELLHLPGDA